MISLTDRPRRRFNMLKSAEKLPIRANWCQRCGTRHRHAPDTGQWSTVSLVCQGPKGEWAAHAASVGIVICVMWKTLAVTYVDHYRFIQKLIFSPVGNFTFYVPQEFSQKDGRCLQQTWKLTGSITVVMHHPAVKRSKNSQIYSELHGLQAHVSDHKTQTSLTLTQFSKMLLIAHDVSQKCFLIESLLAVWPITAVSITDNHSLPADSQISLIN